MRSKIHSWLGSFFALFRLIIQRPIPKKQIIDTLQAFNPIQASDIPALTRIGGLGDGGYWLPDDFEGIEAVFSPGVGDVANFEMHFAQNGVPVFLVDHTVDHPPVFHELFRFQKLRLAPETHPGFSVNLTDWVAECAPQGDLILQMDIEGDEYEALLTSSEELLARFRLIAIEMHDISSVATKSGRALLASTLRLIHKTHRLVFQAHNDSCRRLYVKGIRIPNCLELTFLRRDRFNQND